MQTKIVNRPIIDNWIKENSPDGVAKLAMKSGVSTHQIVRVRLGNVPKSLKRQEKLAKALAVKVESLFPEVWIDDDELAS
jgi:transcriptional regulator with XRE-family HTH domain